MNSNVLIPHGDDKITIELTVKEAIALSGGVRFNEKGNNLLPSAHYKVKRALESRLLPAVKETVDYQALEI